MQARPRPALFALLLLVVLAGVELGARGLEWARDRWWTAPPERAFVDAQNPVPVFERHPDGVYRRTAHHLIPWQEQFLAQKPARGLRVFLLGGSAAQGWPYELGRDSIAAQLRSRLSALLPDRHVEVVNAAGGTYASHRVRFVFDEILAYEPDLILVYSGNNEFLERLAFRPRRPPGLLRHSALARVVHRAGVQGAARPRFDVRDYGLADQTRNRLAFAFGRASPQRLDPERSADVIAHYRHNIESMIRGARARGVPLMLLSVPVNLREWAPNASVHADDLAPAAREAWHLRFQQGMRALDAGDLDAAVAAFGRAAQHSDAHAETHYRLGQALARRGLAGEARAAFGRALERDAFPFRALPAFNRILSELAAEHRIPLVDVAAALAQRAPGGSPGFETLVDYVHLTRESQRRVAGLVLDVAAEQGWLPRRAASEVVAAHAGEPPLAIQARGVELLYRQFLIMRQYDHLDAVYERLRALMERGIASDDGDLARYCARRLDIARRVHAIASPYAAMIRSEQRGRLARNYTPAEADALRTAYVELIRETEGRSLGRAEFDALVNAGVAAEAG